MAKEVNSRNRASMTETNVKDRNINNNHVGMKKSASTPALGYPISPSLVEAMHNKSDKSLIAYGVSYLEEKPDKPRLLRINSKVKLNQGPILGPKKSRKSMSDLDSGFDSLESSSADSGNTSSPTASESSVTVDTVDGMDDDEWMTYEGYPFENLAMSGGGAKGYAYIGALKALQDSGALYNIKRIVGTSAGAVIGGMLSVGATPQEIADFFKCDVKKLFQDKSTTMCLFIPRLLTKFGINSGQRFYEIYGDFLAKKSGDADITFDRVYRVYRKELCVTVTNLSRMCSEYCHYTTTPDLPIRMAVKISMAFPGVYESMKTDLFGTGRNLYVDGGTLENFPVQYFDETDEDTGKPIFNDKTIGLYLMSEDQFSHKIWQQTFQAQMDPFPSYLPDTKLAKERLKDELRRRKKRDRSFDGTKYTAELKAGPYILETSGKQYKRHYEASNKDEIDIKGPKNYFKAMLSTLLISQKHMLVQPADLERTIGINCGYIDTKDTGIEPGDREFMIRQGYEQTRSFMRQHLVHAKLEAASKQKRKATHIPTAKTKSKANADRNERLSSNGVQLRAKDVRVPMRSVSVPARMNEDLYESKPKKPDSLFLSNVNFAMGEDSPGGYHSPVSSCDSPGSDSCFDLDQLTASMQSAKLKQHIQQEKVNQLQQQQQQQQQKKRPPSLSPTSGPLATLHESSRSSSPVLPENDVPAGAASDTSDRLSTTIDLSDSMFTRL